MHVIAAKAVAFGEALQPEFKDYGRQVIANAQALARVLTEGGVGIVSGGTDCHMVQADLRPKGVTGKVAEIALKHHLGMTCDPAANLALRNDGTHFMPLDNCIRMMRNTGHDMNVKYKKTLQDGSAVNLPEC